MEQFKNTIMALASSAEVQDALYPDFVAKGDELVLDYEEEFEKLDLNSVLNKQQREALEKLDRFFLEHAGEKFIDMYCDNSALYNDSRWNTIRHLANEFINAMGWQYVQPVNNNATYIDENSVTENK